jgi:hypothetical protein
MLVLFDHGTPRGLARALHGHTVTTAQARGWDQLGNGALLKAAEDAGFDILLTTQANKVPAEPCRTKNCSGCPDRNHEMVSRQVAR